MDGHSCERLTLRQLLWMYEGITYQQLTVACSVVAGVWNGQRTRQTDRVWVYTDFHPAHIGRAVNDGLTGREVIQSVTCWYAAEDIEWADGYGPTQL